MDLGLHIKQAAKQMGVANDKVIQMPWIQPAPGIAARLSLSRTALGISQKEMALRLPVDPSTLARGTREPGQVLGEGRGDTR